MKTPVSESATCVGLKHYYKETWTKLFSSEFYALLKTGFLQNSSRQLN